MSRSDFRLARHSLRRRRLLSMPSVMGQQVSAGGHVADGETWGEQESACTLDSGVIESPEPSSPVTPVVERAAREVHVRTTLPVAPPPVFRPVAPIDAKFLRMPRPLTWVFAGDALLAGNNGDDQLSPLVTLFAEQIRVWPNRAQDRMVDVLRRESSVTRLMSAWENRVVAHQPDVVVLCFGHHDAAAGMRGFERFEDALDALLSYCANTGIVPIVNTPPCLPEMDECRLADRLIYLEALRAAAKTHDAILIDHWEEWEWIAIEVGGTEAWYDGTGKYPGALGHRQMTRLFARTLGRLDEHAVPTVTQKAPQNA